MQLRGPLTGAEVGAIVRVHPIRDVLESQRGSFPFHDVEKFVLAMKTARRIVTHVLRPRHFFRRNNFEWNLHLLSKTYCIFQFLTRQAGRIGEHGQHPRPYNSMSGPCEKC